MSVCCECIASDFFSSCPYFQLCWRKCSMILSTNTYQMCIPPAQLFPCHLAVCVFSPSLPPWISLSNGFTTWPVFFFKAPTFDFTDSFFVCFLICQSIFLIICLSLFTQGITYLILLLGSRNGFFTHWPLLPPFGIAHTSLCRQEPVTGKVLGPAPSYTVFILLTLRSNCGLTCLLGQHLNLELSAEEDSCHVQWC